MQSLHRRHNLRVVDYQREVDARRAEGGHVHRYWPERSDGIGDCMTAISDTGANDCNNAALVFNGDVAELHQVRHNSVEV